jgi:AraC-like DNA-binding protein
MKEVIFLSEEDLVKIRSAARMIENELKYHYKIEELAEKVWININKLKKGFKIEYGMGPYAFLMQKRMEKAKILLLENRSIISISIAMGFSGFYAESNFIKSFKKFTGQSPAAWRKKQLQIQKQQNINRLSA